MFEYDPVSFEFDADGDGVNESVAQMFDTDNDGVYDAITVATDADHDGYAESVRQIYDTNGDGMIDTIVDQVDTNNSGMADMVITQQDTTGDGNMNLVTKANDYDQDGQIDNVKIYSDYNADGRHEEVTKIYDSDGDGIMDKADVFTEGTGWGGHTSHSTYAFNPSTGELIPSMASNFSFGGTYYTELDNFDPSSVSDYDLISGEPQSSIDYWEFQGDTNRCALYSQKFVIEEFTGQEIDIEQFAEEAARNGWFTEEGGTTYLNMSQMLDHYGIENEMKFHQSIEDIEECLNNGGRVIVSLDADQTWYGNNHDIFSPEDSSNHAVEVIGIDRTDPNNPMVILNDSGSPKGKGEMIPMDVFQEAWDSGDNQMIACYPSSK